MLNSFFGHVFHSLRNSHLGSKVRERIKRSGALTPVTKFALQRAIDYRYPRIFNIEPTSFCNISCVMCPRERPNKANGFIKWDLFTKIVDETRKFGPRSLTLHKDGEPLMHKQIVDMVEYIKRTNPRHNIYMSSNGLILKEEHARGFIRHRLDSLHFSIGAIEQGTYQAVRGGDLEDLEDRIDMLLDMKRAEGAEFPHVAVQIIRMPETMDEVEPFRQKWESKGVQVSVQELRHWAGGIEAQEGEAQPDDEPDRHPCHALWFAPSINWDGKVSFCCFDWDSRGVLGDLNHQSMEEIWTGDVVRWHREKHLHGEYNFPECSSCDHHRDYPDLWYDRQKFPSRSDAAENDRPPRYPGQPEGPEPERLILS